MKALSIRQPHASLLAIGARRIETRSWGTPYRGPLLIHAARRWDEDIVETCLLARDILDESGWKVADERSRRLGDLPWDQTLGCVLAVAILADCRPMPESPGGLDGEFGSFGSGRYGWVLEEVRPLDPPIPWRGAQRLWDVPPELVDRIVEASVEVMPMFDLGPTPDAGSHFDHRARQAVTPDRLGPGGDHAVTIV